MCIITSSLCQSCMLSGTSAVTLINCSSSCNLHANRPSLAERRNKQPPHGSSALYVVHPWPSYARCYSMPYVAS
jgi:hypothetical protein